MSKELNILLVAAEAENLSFYPRLNERYSLTSTERGCQALQIMKASPVDVLVTEDELADMTGSELLDHAASTLENSAAVVIHRHVEACAQAEKAASREELVEHLNHPVGEFTLFSAVDSLVRRRGG